MVSGWSNAARDRSGRTRSNPVGGRTEPIEIQSRSGRLRDGFFSPNGNYIVFVSDETGRDEVYVQATPHAAAATPRTKISLNSGIFPRWRLDGKELYFVSPADNSTLMAVDVDTGATFQRAYRGHFSKRVETEPGVRLYGPWRRTAVPDTATRCAIGNRPITVVLNWWAELE